MRPLVALLLFTLPLVAAPVPKGVKKKVSSPDGVWLLVEFGSDGQLAPVNGTGMTLDWVIDGEWMGIGTKQRPVPGQPRPSNNLTIPDPEKPNERLFGGSQRAVLEVDGDTLRFGYAHDGRKELSECKPQQGVHFYVYKRVPDGK